MLFRSQQLIDLLDDLSSLKEIFSPVAELQSDDTLLGSEEGFIAYLLASLDEAIRACGPLATDNTISMVELANRIESLDSLRSSVNKWEKKDLDNNLFQGRLGLKVGMNVDNSISLPIFRNTLLVASCLDEQVTNKDVSQHIYDQPTVQTFNSLSTISQKLRIAVDAQEDKYIFFKNLVEMTSEDWMIQTGDNIDRLVIRNKLALNNGETLQNWLDYVRAREQIANMGLSKLADRVEQGDIDIQQVDGAHKAGVFDLLAREILHEQPELGQFSGHAQEALQDQFREYDNRLKQLQCEQIAWQIDQTKIPQGNLGEIGRAHV